MHSAPISLGIDLGTTNCAATLYYEDGRHEPVLIDQPVAETQSERLPLLPSFLYKSPEGATITGEFARFQLGRQPGRVVQSAKSWLAHHAVSAESPFLPFGSEDLEPHDLVSPIDASAEYLRKIRSAVESRTGGTLSEISTIVITVPASFDELSCRHTLTAARLAGYPDEIRLLEEPQAALYRIPPQDLMDLNTVLVCDIGGGTTDFSLFRIISTPGKRDPAIERIKVGEHLLLGGDNIDLEICNFLNERFQTEGFSLNRTQLLTLQAQSRKLKERVFSRDGEETLPVAVVGGGSSLFSSAASIRVRSNEIRSFVLNRFFPALMQDETGASPGRMQFGLPYPVDARFTAHLASFIQGCSIDAVLFVGGSMTPAVFRRALLAQIESLQGFSAREIEQDSYDLSVSVGSAIFGAKIFKTEERIRSGQVRSFYLKLPDDSLLCILPFGVDEGEFISVTPKAGRLMLRVNTPTRFELFSSLTRTEDLPGETYRPNSEQFQAVGPLRALLSLSGREARVNEISASLNCGVNHLGRLELSLENAERDLRWKLEFGLLHGERVATSGGGLETPGLKQAKALITQVYGKGKTVSTTKEAKSLLRAIEEALGEKREEWSAITLRSLWTALEQGITRRGRSKEHESTWLMLAGYFLRPGVGVELDAERISRLWRVFTLGLSFPREKVCQVQWALMWRRISLGLDADRQVALFDSLLPRRGVLDLISQPELLRLLSALERIPPQRKLKLVSQLISVRKGQDALIDWSLSRLLSRYPLSGALDKMISARDVEPIIEELITSFSDPGLEKILLSSCRVTRDQSLCVSEELRRRARHQLGMLGAKSSELLDSLEEISATEIVEAFGEAFPVGIRLV
jgi:hypothetical protein